MKKPVVIVYPLRGSGEGWQNAKGLSMGARPAAVVLRGDLWSEYLGKGEGGGLV